MAVHFNGSGDSGAKEHFEALVPFGYENDCGGFGDVILDVRARKLTVERALKITRSRPMTVTMAPPLQHAENSGKRFGGKPADYLPIHNWLDESKAFLADFRHRALRHHAEGIFLAERIFGVAVENSDGKQVPVRLLGEQQVKEDLGRIPTAAEWLSEIRPQRWMYGQRLTNARD